MLLVGRARLAVSRRRIARVDAEGKLTISWSTIKGTLMGMTGRAVGPLDVGRWTLDLGLGKAPNGRYCSAPSPTISNRLPFICATTGSSNMPLRRLATAAYSVATLSLVDHCLPLLRRPSARRTSFSISVRLGNSKLLIEVGPMAQR